MTISLLIAVRGRAEAALVARIATAPSVQLVRRCADLPELLSAAASGVASVAVVSADQPGLDRSLLADLAAAGVGVVGVYAVGSEPDELRLRQLGVTVVLGDDAPGPELVAAVERAHPAGPSSETRQRAVDLSAGGGPERDGADVEALAPQPGSISPFAPPPTDGRDGDLAPGTPGPSLIPAANGRPGRGRIVAVWGPTGAPGRTTVAVTLASEAAAAGVQTLLVDADPYGGTVAQAIALLNEAPGLAAAVRSCDQGALDLVTLARLAPEALPGMRVLTGLPKAERWPELRPAPLEEVLAVSCRLAELVVVDCGFCLEDDEELSYDTAAPRRNAATRTVLTCADELVVVGAADPIGLQRLVRGLDDLGALPIRAGRRTVVVNKLRTAAVGADAERHVTEALRRYAGVEDPWLVPDDRDALDAAVLAGRTLGEHAPGSPARQSLQRLALRLVGREDHTPRGRRRRASV